MAKAKKTRALARRADVTPAAERSGMALMLERVTRDPKVDVAKLEKLIELQERVMATNARIAFEKAFNAMHPELPVIKKTGAIVDKNNRVRSRYSKLEVIQRLVQPALKRHGFTIRHRTEHPDDKPDLIKVVGILSHVGGHSEQSTFLGKPDTSDYRTAVQSQGSTISYGRRYTIIDLLNIIQEGADTDGQVAAAGVVDAEVVHHDAKQDEPITQPQRQRLFTIARKAKRSDQEIRAWLAVAYNIDSTKQIKRRDYDAICKAVEAPGPLPAPRSREREPGEEG